jgi:DNA-binding MarR family transcriptional regulator
VPPKASNRGSIGRPASGSPFITTSTASPSVTISTASATAATFRTKANSIFGETSRRNVTPQQRQISNAVLSHIKALRALGKNEVNVAQISEALGIRESAVLAVVPTLVSKGYLLNRPEALIRRRELRGLPDRHRNHVVRLCR